MYRESLLGVAFSATLAELECTCNLSESQKQQLWELFDIAMDQTLSEVSVRTEVRVFTSPPSLLDTGAPGAEPSSSAGGNQNGEKHTGGPLSTKPPGLTFPITQVTQAPVVAPCKIADSGLAYPVYRAHDGMWTILLKNTILEVIDATGVTETIHLDYLKVHLKEILPGMDGRRQTTISGKKRKR
ncbi:hypothetical protein ERJ75_000969400 [Trypanosoma vivax]|uniref:Uncharacterized protein n=1 Tax=Trypanosoma vivax (strain Y486) TaxID=1055687 RepID=G0U6D4_TRYVY|nr:hypothetical protein ERJ75_000969400 [Trypanosoma vivax]CCC51438.1 conserved hypothetical protein [Trypanosoma vivax Y486]